MPNRIWKFTCACRPPRGFPVCQTCGAAGEFDGWDYGMYEKMAAFQTHFGIKATGYHTPMAYDLFQKVTVTCPACEGRGLRDVGGGRSWELCPVCRGLQSLLAGPLTELIENWRKVLEAFPDAAARPVPTHPAVLDLSTGEIVGGQPSKEDSHDSNNGGESNAD